MELKTLINYYDACPSCDGNIVINTDLSIPSTVEKTDEGLLINIYEEAGETVLSLRLNYSNTIESNRPYILSTLSNKLIRLMKGIPENAYDHIQLEMSCMDCGNFKYWSNNIVIDPNEKTMGPLEIRWEWVRIEVDKEKFILKNDVKNKQIVILTNGLPDYDNLPFKTSIPFTGTFKGLPLKNAKELMHEIKKQILIS